jgi:hypothetical protein
MAINGLSLLKSLAKKNAVLIEQRNHAKFEIKQIDGKLCVVYGDGTNDSIPPLTYRPYQQEAHNELFDKGIKRFFLVRPRRAGKETESWNFLIEGALRRPGFYVMMYPTAKRGRMILWNGGISLGGGKSLRFLDMIPQKMIKHRNKTEMYIELINGSIIQVMGADDDPNKMRGSNCVGVVFSEYAFSDPRVFQVMMPTLRENGGWAILQTTFDGMNHAYRLMQEVKNQEGWYCRIDSALTLVDEKGNRYVTDEMIEEDRRSGMAEYMIQQEYFSSVTPNESNIYFAREIKFIDENNRVIPDLMLRAPVYTAWDIGMSDATSIIFFQMDEKGDPKIINYIEDNNKGLEWYVNEIFVFLSKFNLAHAMSFFPHDGERRDFTNTANKTIADSARELGLSVTSISRPKSKLVAIQDMRQMMYRTSFNKERCARIIECLSSYSKIYDEKNDVFKPEALHNWASHGVDSYQTMTIAIKDKHIITGVRHGVVNMLESMQQTSISYMGGLK